MPFDAYAPQGKEITTVAKATDILIANCMRNRGLGWDVIYRGEPQSPPHRFRYGNAEPEVAIRFGYHTPRDPSQLEENARYHARRRTLTAQQITAAYGSDGRGGCLSRAQASLLRGVPQADERFLDRLGLDINAQSQRDPRVAQVIQQWSACMRNSGFHYSDPLTPADDPRWRTPEASKSEIKMAVTDVKCKQQTGLVDVWNRVETYLQHRATVKHPKEFGLLKRAKVVQLSNARAVLFTCPTTQLSWRGCSS